MPTSDKNMTIEEMVLLHLSRFLNVKRSAYLMPYALTQDGIADEIGISRAHASIELKKLCNKGLISFVLAHTKGSR